MGINTQINQTKEALVKTLNTSGLPPVILQLMLENLLAQVSAAVDKEIKSENDKDIDMEEAE